MPLAPADIAVQTARNAMKRGGKIKLHKGPIHSSVAGRTDHLPMHVASGSYVIPADIISAMGEGNSMAGFKVAQSIFSVPGPYGQKIDATPYGGGKMPYGQPAPHKAPGGEIDRRDDATRHEEMSRDHADRATPPSTGGGNGGGYTGLRDMIDGGGAGQTGSTFEGGPFSGVLNALGVHPTGYRNRAEETSSTPTSTPTVAPTATAAPAEPSGGVAGLPEFAPQYLPDLPAFHMIPRQETDPPGYGSEWLLRRNLGLPRAAGGRSEAAPDAVPIVAAGGEYVISPEEVTHIGNGSLDHGHKVLDAFVKKMRMKTIKTLQSLPGPKKN